MKFKKNISKISLGYGLSVYLLLLICFIYMLYCKYKGIIYPIQFHSTATILFLTFFLFILLSMRSYLYVYDFYELRNFPSNFLKFYKEIFTFSPKKRKQSEKDNESLTSESFTTVLIKEASPFLIFLTIFLIIFLLSIYLWYNEFQLITVPYEKLIFIEEKYIKAYLFLFFSPLRIFCAFFRFFSEKKFETKKKLKFLLWISHQLLSIYFTFLFYSYLRSIQ